MKKVTKLYLFLLGTLFGVTISLLVAILANDYFGYNYATQSIELKDSNNLLSSLKDSFTSLPVSGKCDEYSKFDELWKTLSTQYYDKNSLDYDKSVENALKGFVDAVGDPYTIYFNRKESSDFQDDLKGETNFEGIGAVVRKKENGVMLEEVFKKSPAFNAGLKPLDMIIEVGGEKTSAMTLSEAVSLIRGPKGSEVILTVYRSSEDKVFKVTVIRDKIVVPSVSGKALSLTGEVKVGYIELSSFGQETPNAFKSVVKDLKSQNISGVILDLRGNGGGFLMGAVNISSYFVEEGRLIVSSKYRIFPEEKFNSEGFGDLEKLPLIILIDGLSASSSEIVAAGIRENRENDSKLLGTKSFGKGSIQTIHDMNDWGSLKYTIGKWYSPDGSNFDKAGIEPDIEVEFDAELYRDQEIDSQLEAAKVEILKMIGE